MSILLRALACALALPLIGAAADPTKLPCRKEAPCVVAHSAYVAVAPDGWDGHTPLPVVVWLHGYQESIKVVLGEADQMEVFRHSGRLLLIAEGAHGSWAVPGTPGNQPTARRDDLGFIAGVLEDAARRFPVVTADATLMGFSLGGSMTWEVACRRPELFRHYVAFAGAFWNPIPETCKSGNIDFIHVHGTDDDMVPLHGRPIGWNSRQADVPKSIAALHVTERCESDVPLAGAPADLTCTKARRCASDSAIRFCLHKGGHYADPDWVAWALKR